MEEKINELEKMVKELKKKILKEIYKNAEKNMMNIPMLDGFLRDIYLRICIELDNYIAKEEREEILKRQLVGTDGESVNALEEYQTIVPDEYYKVYTSAGNVLCTGNHEWVIYTDHNTMVCNTFALKGEVSLYGSNIGKKDGPCFLGVSKVRNDDYLEFQCIKIDAKDRQFVILTDKNKPILTRDCGLRDGIRFEGI